MRHRTVGFTVKALGNQIKRYMHCNMEPMNNMTGMQRGVIGYLGERLGEDVFQRDLEAAFNMRRSTATGILQLMEKNGLLRREPVPYDARLKKLILTEEGLRIRHESIIAMQRFEQVLTRDIGGEELESFFKVADQMIRNLEEGAQAEAKL